MKPAVFLYLVHTLLELVLGAVKLRGTYSGLENMPDGAAKFARHHGVALLSLSLLGAETLRRRLVHTEAGTMVSGVLAGFHTGAVVVMLHAAHLKVVYIHLPLAIGFAVHAMTAPPSRKR